MRPQLLQPLFASLRSLDGVGPKTANLMAKLCRTHKDEPRLIDLIHLRPTALIDRRARPGVAHAKAGEIVTLDLHIHEHRPPPASKRHLPYIVYGSDETGAIALIFFHAQIPWLEQQLPIGADVIVSKIYPWLNPSIPSQSACPRKS